MGKGLYIKVSRASRRHELYLNTRASLGSKCRGYSGLSERLQKATLTGKYFIYSLSTIKF